jgi:hypothetical protein
VKIAQSLLQRLRERVLPEEGELALQFDPFGHGIETTTSPTERLTLRQSKSVDQPDAADSAQQDTCPFGVGVGSETIGPAYQHAATFS